MKTLMLVILLMFTNMAFADRYYGDSSKVPYVKSSNRAYEKSWNSWAKHRNIGINVARTRAVSERLNARSYSNSYNHDYSNSYTGGHGYTGDGDAVPHDPKVVAQCEAIMIEHNYSDSEKPSALSRCINYKMGNL